MKYFALWAPSTWNPERLDGFSVLGDETMALKWYENISLSFFRHLWSWVAIPRSHGDINALLAFVFFFEKAIGELEVFGSKMIENMKPESLEISMEFWVQFLDRRTILLLEHNLPTTFARFRPSTLPQSLLGKSWLIKQSRLPFC